MSDWYDKTSAANRAHIQEQQRQSDEIRRRNQERRAQEELERHHREMERLSRGPSPITTAIAAGVGAALATKAIRTHEPQAVHPNQKAGSWMIARMASTDLTEMKDKLEDIISKFIEVADDGNRVVILFYPTVLSVMLDIMRAFPRPVSYVNKWNQETQEYILSMGQSEVLFLETSEPGVWEELNALTGGDEDTEEPPPNKKTQPRSEGVHPHYKGHSSGAGFWRGVGVAVLILGGIFMIEVIVAGLVI